GRLVVTHIPGLQGPAERIGGRPAAFWVLLQTAGHRQRQILRYVGPGASDIGRRLGDLLHQDPGDRRGIEGKLSGQHLVGDYAEAVEIRAAVDAALAGGLFRAHEVRGPYSNT